MPAELAGLAHNAQDLLTDVEREGRALSDGYSKPMPQIDARQDVENITSFEVVKLGDLESSIVKQGANYWHALRGTRRYPARKELRPRDFASILRNTLLVRVIDAGADFEFRIVGDAQAQTYALPFAGKCLSEFAPSDTAYCYVLKGFFGHVTEHGEPVAVRGNMGSISSNVQFSYCESIFLPLGESDDAVDHLLGFSAYIPRDFSNYEI
jgi:hypothetical protein